MNLTDILPRQNSDLIVQELDDDLILYHPENEHVHVLNHTAHAVWKLCDGLHTAADAVESLASLFHGAKKNTICADVSDVIDDLFKKKLVSLDVQKA